MAPPGRMETDTTMIMSVTGWTGSKAAGGSQDRGASTLKDWLEKKSRRPISQWTVQGDTMIIEILAKDARSFHHINGWTFAGVDVTITEGQNGGGQSQSNAPRGPRSHASNPPSGPRNQSNGFGGGRGGGFGGGGNNDLSSRISGGPTHHINHNNSSKELFSNNNQNNSRNNHFGNNSSRGGNNSRGGFSNSHSSRNNQDDEAARLKAALIGIIRKRYNAAEKFLDFTSLASDPDFANFDLSQYSTSKMFAAIISICEKDIFETFHKRNEMVQSLSFKDNALTSVKEIISAASTFSQIKNLDLSNNNFDNIRALTFWKRRFPLLEQIILLGNPIDTPETREEVSKWYPKLVTYNMQPLSSFPTNNAPLGFQPPIPTASPAPTEPHPEFPPGSTFGLPTPDKSPEQLAKEQMGLKFSFETYLKMQFVEQCLSANNWDYNKAIEDLKEACASGRVPNDAFIQV